MKRGTLTLALISFILFASVINVSCKKSWLDKKVNKNDVTPVSLADFQGMLDNTAVMNVSPALGSAGADNYYISFTDFQTLTQFQRNTYTWSSDIFGTNSSTEWNGTYQVIEYCNIVLDALNKIQETSSNQISFDNIKGSAYFFRAKAFLDLASVWAKPYDSTSSRSDLGIPIRLTSDVNIKSVRSTVQETYDRIISDLIESETLLPTVASFQTRPSKIAVYALLSKVYLNMGNYNNAGQYSNKALSNYSTLIDFNSLPNSTFPLPSYPNNKEVIFWSRANSFNFLYSSSPCQIDSNLYNSYDNNDLRKVKFYLLSGNKNLFRGPYTGSAGYLFSGLATNELYLIRAECYARNGNTSAAMADLNTLLQKRWSNSVSYPPITASDPNDALNKVLVERRKELPFTEPVRWDDLRRLNKDSRFAKTITRNLNGTIYTLPPNDNRYVYPIPPDEIKLSGIQQNPR